MKIALVSQEYPPETAHGGIGSQTYTKAHGLADLGHEVFVISRSINSKRHEYRDNNICVIRIPGMEDQMWDMTDIVQWLTHSMVVAAEIEALHKRIQLDIIDFPEWAAEGYIFLLNRTEWNRIPVVIQLHGPLVMFAHTMGWPEINSEFYRIGSDMEATSIRLADAVYSSSECSAEWIRKYYHFQKKTIPVIHVGVDIIKFVPQAVPKNDRPTIIFIGKLVLNKGIEELVEAASELVKEFPNLQLRIIARDNVGIRKRLEERSVELGATHLLNFAGFINKDDLPPELSRAHIFAAPSYYEGGPGFVYLEAMACGLPVIGCSGSGIDEIIQNGKNGLLVPPRNAKALEEALRMVLNDKAMSESLGKNAREYVLEEANNQKCIYKLEAFYQSVLENRA